MTAKYTNNQAAMMALRAAGREDAKKAEDAAESLPPEPAREWMCPCSCHKDGEPYCDDCFVRHSSQSVKPVDCEEPDQGAEERAIDAIADAMQLRGEDEIVGFHLLEIEENLRGPWSKEDVAYLEDVLRRLFHAASAELKLQPDSSSIPANSNTAEVKLLADVLHLWVDGYISKNPNSAAPDAISNGTFDEVEGFLATRGISVDYCGWQVSDTDSSSISTAPERLVSDESIKEAVDDARNERGELSAIQKAFIELQQWRKFAAKGSTDPATR